MKNIYNIVKKYEKHEEIEYLNCRQSPQTIDSTEQTEHSVPELYRNSMNFLPVTSLPSGFMTSSSFQESEQEIPCCSSQVQYKTEPQYISCNTINQDHRTALPLIKKEIKEENQECIVKNEPETSHEHLLFSSYFHRYHLQKLPKKENIQIMMANYYQEKMNCLSKKFFPEKYPSTISRGMYDYKRVCFSKTIVSDKKIGIEVLNRHLSCFDKHLLIPNSFYRLSSCPKRRAFQVMIKEEINAKIRDKAFSDFVHLSLGGGISNDNSYFSWRKSISTVFPTILYNVKKRTLNESSNKDSSKAISRKTKKYLEENYLDISEKFLVREIMRHALFSISIERNGKQREILVSRISLGYFLNKYSDFFLKEFIENLEKNILGKKMMSSFFFWKKTKNELIKTIIESARPKFESLFKSDEEDIHKQVLVLEETGFRPLTDDEFKGLIIFIRHLVDYRGRSGIIERASHHFYKEKNDKEDMPAHIENKNTLINFAKKEKKTSKPIRRIHKVEAINNSILAKTYCQLMFGLIQKGEKISQPSISGSAFDYKRVRWSRSNLDIKKSEETGMEVTNNCFLSFDPVFFFSKGLNAYQLSRNSKKREFQEKLKETINEKLKKSLFLDFVNMSLPGEGKSSYFFWKESFSKKMNNLSHILAQEIFGNSKEEKIEKFIKKYSSFRSQSLIKEIFRYSLFSLQTEVDGNSESILISRAGLSYFLNKYADYFLSAFLEYTRFNRRFIGGSRSSYISWKRSKKEEIIEVVNSSEALFKEFVKKDHENIKTEVLAFERTGFRSMTDNEFQILINLIHYLVRTNGPSSFIDRSTRYFYRTYVQEDPSIEKPVDTIKK